MSRPLLATIAALLFLLAYLAAVLAIADHVLGLHWAIQALFFVAAGVAWVWPVRALMLWSVAGRK